MPKFKKQTQKKVSKFTAILSKKSFRVTLPLAFIAVVGAVGAYTITRSNAQTTHTPFEYKVASYNVLGSGAIAAPGHNSEHRTNTRERMNHATTVMRNFDIIGTQELDYYKEQRFDKNQFYMFKDKLKDTYAMYPASSPTSTNKRLNFDKESMRAIFWKKDRFNVVNTGSLRYPYQDSPRINGQYQLNDKAPWVLLEDKDDPRVKFYVINVHTIAYNNDNCRWDCNPPNERGGTDKPGDQKRQEAGRILKQWIAEKKQRYPVILTGDMNSSFTLRKKGDPRPAPVVERKNGLLYCIITNNNIIRNTRDVKLGRTGQCPTNSPDEWFIDHVYATGAFGVKRWGKFSDEHTAIASDHRPTYAVLTLTPPDPPINNNDDPTDPPAETYSSDPMKLLND